MARSGFPLDQGTRGSGKEEDFYFLEQFQIYINTEKTVQSSHTPCTQLLLLASYISMALLPQLMNPY